MSRRNERMDFQYGAPQPNAAAQQHHPTPVQPPMNVPQPPNAPPTQQQASTPTPATGGRRQKRPAPAPSPAAASAAPSVPATPATAPAPQTAATSTPAQAAAEDANATPSNPPPAKKSRTNTPWTPAEELRLKQMRDAGNSWAEIAKVCEYYGRTWMSAQLTLFSRPSLLELKVA
jgi:hypothetical protein